MFDLLDRLRPGERVTAALAVVFCASFVAAVAIDDPFVWVGWAAAMAVAAGATLVRVNR